MGECHQNPRAGRRLRQQYNLRHRQERSALADEVAKLYHYWDTRRNDKGVRMSPVGRVFLLGGGSNLKGIADYIAERVQAPAMRPNVWQNVCTFNDYVPPIDRRASLQYATAVGLSLRNF